MIRTFLYLEARRELGQSARHLTTALGRKRYWVTVGKCARCYEEFVVNGAIES